MTSLYFLAYDDPDSTPFHVRGVATMVASHALNNSQPESSGELSARDASMLDFERQWWKYAGAKEQAVREQFDMSSTRYYQVLNALIDRPEALAHDPLLVRRLRRLRATRQRQRSARRLGFDLSE
jgi:hypothetical protein